MTSLLVDIYKATGIPTQYVIDADGIIRAFSVGLNDKSDALKKSVRAASVTKP